jgi:nucleotide-binding universal stress UspA family protein
MSAFGPRADLRLPVVTGAVSDKELSLTFTGLADFATGRVAQQIGCVINPDQGGGNRTPAQGVMSAGCPGWRSPMAYRVVLVPMTGDPAEASALGVTRAVTERLRVHVIGIHVRDPVGSAIAGVTLDGGWLTPGVLESLEDAWRLGAATARDSFRKWQVAHGIASATAPAPSAGATAEWIEIQAPVPQEIARRARTADLVVLARSPREPGADTDRVLQGALFDSGRPVLLVPGAVDADPLRTVMIAWNDSREAAHAVAAAWSLIGRARRIVVFVGGEDEAMRRSADRLVSHLAWRGYAPATVVGDPSKETGPGLLATAAREKAGMVVMGAYTHSRLRHLVFGGATSYVLGRATIPVLMAH